jgi:ABC-type nitrate/sulfonate/bicarbonate transport system permease component
MTAAADPARRPAAVPRGAISAAGGIVAVFALWELAARALTGAYVLAGPTEVLSFLLDNRALMMRNLGVTLANAAAGFVIGNAVAVALAIAALLWPRSERVITSLALLVFCLPLVATGPILRVFLGPGSGPQIALAALAVYYTTLIPLLVGLRAAPAGWFDIVRSYGRGRFSTLIHVRAMASLPYFFAGLQIAAPAAFLGAMVGEFTGAEAGMGVLTIRAMRALDVEMTWALATVATMVAMLAYAAVGLLARLVLLDRPPTILAPPRVGRDPRSGGPGHVLLVAAVAVALWWGAMALLDLSPFFAKRPGDVLDALAFAPDAAATRATLASALGETAVLLLPGYLAGLAAGAGLAIAFILWPGLASAIMPVAVALRSVPIVTTAPLVVLLLGRGATGTITLVAIMVFFPTLVACLHGLRQAPGQVLDVFDSYAAGPFVRLVRVRIPAMLPAFFAAARMGVPASVLAVTVVEWLATGNGIGSLMAMSGSLSDYDMLWSAVVIVSVLSALGYGAVEMLERRVLRVYAPEQLA